MTNSPAATDTLRDIKPPWEISSAWEWLWWALGTLAAAALASMAWRWWRKRKAHAVLVPPLPAHVRAKQKLQEALALISEPKPFCTLVSDTIRFYLEERFNFHAPERTTEEFLYELQGTNLLLPDQKDSLREFLNRCDLVKFAKFEPGEPGLRDLHESAFRLVEETIPPAEAFAPPTGISEARSVPGGDDRVLHAAPKPAGKTLAIVGAILQAAPVVWLVSFIIMLMRLTSANAGTGLKQTHASAPDADTEVSRLVQIVQGELIITIICILAGLAGLVCLTLALTKWRYRGAWFFWFLVVYSIPMFLNFPIGTAFSVFFVVYCLKHRGEFPSNRSEAR